MNPLARFVPRAGRDSTDRSARGEKLIHFEILFFQFDKVIIALFVKIAGQMWGAGNDFQAVH